jgi:hypothetical protein
LREDGFDISRRYCRTGTYDRGYDDCQRGKEACRLRRIKLVFRTGSGLFLCFLGGFLIGKAPRASYQITSKRELTGKRPD